MYKYFKYILSIFLLTAFSASAENAISKEITISPQENAVIQVALEEFVKTKISLKDYLITLQRIKKDEDYVVRIHSKFSKKDTNGSVRYGNSTSTHSDFEVAIKTTPTSIDIVRSYFVR